MSFLALLLALSSPVAFAGTAEDAFSAGVASLREGQPEAAIEAFEQAEAAGARAPAVYHGLGNALYRAGDTGRAVAVWRRGQRLDPGNGDLVANLEHARRDLVDRVEPPESSVGPFLWLAWIAAGRVLMIGAALLGLGLGLGALGTWRRRKGRSQGPARLAALPASLGLVLVGSALLVQAPDTVVVVADEVSAVSALGGDGVVLFELHAGTEVVRLEEDHEHVLVELPDGRKGWLPGHEVLSTLPDEPLELARGL